MNSKFEQTVNNNERDITKKETRYAISLSNMTRDDVITLAWMIVENRKDKNNRLTEGGRSLLYLAETIAGAVGEDEITNTIRGL